MDLDHALDATRDLWPALRGRRLLLTGGTGFVGRWLLETFLHANDLLGLGAEVTVLTRDPEAFAVRAPDLSASPAVRMLRGASRTDAWRGGPFAFMIHAEPGAGDGTRRILDVAARDGATVLLTSSGAVYGAREGCPDPHETTPLLAHTTAYGEGKRADERLAAAYHEDHGLAVKVARCFAFVGPHLPLDAHFAAGNFIRDGLAGGPIRVLGDGTPMRSYLYAADLAVWLWTILFRGSPGRAYNVGGEEQVSIGALARIVAEETGAPGVTFAREPDPGRPVERYVAATARARSELGLRETVGLREGVRRTVAWHRAGAGRNGEGA